MNTGAARAYQLVQVDVFTDRVFGGNALAVLPDAEGLSDAEMQAIAREMNLSETTFVLRPGRPDCAARVRIFTPTRELPFAGHPTIGTAYVLATRGRLPAGAAEAALEEGIGPVPVRLEGDPRAPSFIWMGQAEPSFGPVLEQRRSLARALGLGEADLLEGAPIRTGSAGVLFLYVPLRSAEAVDRAALDVTALLDCYEEAGGASVFVFAPDPDPAAGRVYARMFAPHTAGIPEDPASGSAAGPLGAYLVAEGLVPRGEEVRIVCEQGTRMGRQSFIHVRLRARDGRATDIRVGGGVAPVLEGVLRLP
jgi:trans-2,3-dihydro-3-hydroxyanthranilate isomerase